MINKHATHGGRWPKDRGQITIFVTLALALFLLGFVGFAVDMTNLWFHRQMAQGAADAACQAGVMDMFFQAQGSAVGPAGQFPRSAFDCSGSTYSPCQYASFNGYPAAQSGQVRVSFPTSVPLPPGVTLPPSGLISVPFIRVDINDPVRMYFAPLITRNTTQVVHASADCAVVWSEVPVPILILHPTCPITFDIKDSAASLQVVGGPPQSVQVNSDNTTAVEISGPADLQLGGPTFSGSNFGVFGGPTTAPGPFNGGTTGTYISPHSPISDPFATLAPPTIPVAVPPQNGTPVIFNQDGCPDPAGCTRYQPGRYNSAIVVKNATAIFDPGVYYIFGTTLGNCANMPNGACWRPNGQCRYGLSLESNSLIRPSTAAGDGNGGTLFYFSGTGAGNYGSVFVGSNSGSRGGVTPFDTSLATCPGGTPPDPQLNLPATLTGNIFLGPCTGTFGSADGKSRGMLLWNNRDNADLKGQASMQGGGQMLLSGTIYFHNCSSTGGAGLGTDCQAPNSGYNGFFQLQGNPGSATYILGYLVTDDLSLGGSATVKMSIDPNKKFPVLKASLIR